MNSLHQALFATLNAVRKRFYSDDITRVEDFLDTLESHGFMVIKISTYESMKCITQSYRGGEK